MFSTLLAVMLCASTDVGSTWSWNFEDTRQTSMTPMPKGINLAATPTLGKSTMVVKVLEAGTSGPRKLLLTVKSGPASLVGSRWELENNYGEITARRVKLPKNGNDEEEGRPLLPHETALMATSRLLLVPDPIVEAAALGCTPEATAALIKATARAVGRVYSEREVVVETAGEARCGKTAGTYDVNFTITQQLRDDPFVVQWKGTVSVPKGATHATLQLTGSSDTPLTMFKKPTVMKLRSTLRSSVTPNK